MKKSLRKKMLPSAIKTAVIAVLVLIDQLIKNVVINNLELYNKNVGGEPITAIKGVIGWFRVHNTGGAWSMFSDYTIVLTVIVSVIIATWYIALMIGKIDGKIVNVCAVLIIAGGLGNLVDRIRFSYVVDYIYTLFMDFPIYNFADILITCGIFMLIGYLIYDLIKTTRAEKIKKDEEKTE